MNENRPRSAVGTVRCSATSSRDWGLGRPRGGGGSTTRAGPLARSGAGTTDQQAQQRESMDHGGPVTEPQSAAARSSIRVAGIGRARSVKPPAAPAARRTPSGLPPGRATPPRGTDRRGSPEPTACRPDRRPVAPRPAGCRSDRESRARTARWSSTDSSQIGGRDPPRQAPPGVVDGDGEGFVVATGGHQGPDPDLDEGPVGRRIGLGQGGVDVPRVRGRRPRPAPCARAEPRGSPDRRRWRRASHAPPRSGPGPTATRPARSDRGRGRGRREPTRRRRWRRRSGPGVPACRGGCGDRVDPRARRGAGRGDRARCSTARARSRSADRTGPGVERSGTATLRGVGDPAEVQRRGDPRSIRGAARSRRRHRVARWQPAGARSRRRTPRQIPQAIRSDARAAGSAGAGQPRQAMGLGQIRIELQGALGAGPSPRRGPPACRWTSPHPQPGPRARPVQAHHPGQGTISIRCRRPGRAGTTAAPGWGSGGGVLAGGGGGAGRRWPHPAISNSRTPTGRDDLGRRSG